MNANEFKAVLDKSQGSQFIMAGMVGLVEDEGYSPRDVFVLLEAFKRNTFHALQEISKEVKNT